MALKHFQMTSITFKMRNEIVLYWHHYHCKNLRVLWTKSTRAFWWDDSEEFNRLRILSSNWVSDSASNMDLSIMYLGQEQRKCSTVSNVLQWLQRPVSCKLSLKRLLLRPILPILRQWIIDSLLLSFRWHLYVLQTFCRKTLSGEIVSSHKDCHFLWKYIFSRWFNSFLLSLLLISMSGFCKASHFL